MLECSNFWVFEQFNDTQFWNINMKLMAGERRGGEQGR